MSDVKIAGCIECPLFDDDRADCRNPEAPADRAPSDAVHAWQGFDDTGREVLRAPAWCPLRQGVLTITLRTTGKSKVRR